MKELKELLKTKESESILNLGNTMEKQNAILIDKMCLSLNEIIPKSQTKNYEEIIKFFKEDMKSTLEKINDPHSEISLDKISSIIDTKYNNIVFNLQEQMMKYIALSEDRLNNNLVQIKDISTKNSIIQEKISEDFTNYLNRYKTGSFKGTQGENKLYDIITDYYSSAELVNTSGLSGMGDMILKRKHKTNILIETKEYTVNVKKDEVDKFLRDVNKNNCSGIFLSHNSGIVGKENYQIDVNGKNILIFVHNVNYDINKIKLAVNTIDILLEKMQNVDEKNIYITADVLTNINTEYQKFLLQRDILISNLKDFYKKTIDQYNEISLPNLEVFLSKHFAENKKNIVTCEFCKSYQCDNLKSMARHYTACKKKIGIDISKENKKSDNKKSNTKKEMTV
jgi:hypothetical protein